MAKDRKRGPGRPRLAGNGKGAAKLVGIRCAPERLDKWRKAQEGKPNRSEALRRLTESALQSAGY
jgi:hypothetical protein